MVHPIVAFLLMFNGVFIISLNFISENNALILLIPSLSVRAKMGLNLDGIEKLR